MRRIACLIVLAFAFAASSVRPAMGATGFDVADLWGNPNESGWGLQLVQQSSTVFATLYVYDAHTIPMWYIAVLRQTGLNAAGGPVFQGDLLETRGPWFGTTPFDSSQVQGGKVGTMTFDSPSISTATLTYSINGVTVVKQVQRTTLTNDNFNGTFLGIYRGTASGCANPADNGSADVLTAFNITQSGATMRLSMTNYFSNGSVGVCVFDGTYTQTGSIGDYQSTYSCSNGEAGTIRFVEMVAARFGIMGRFVGSNNLGCSVSGRFAAAE